MGHIDMRAKVAKKKTSNEKSQKEGKYSLLSDIKQCKNAKKIGSVIIHYLI